MPQRSALAAFRKLQIKLALSFCASAVNNPHFLSGSSVAYCQAVNYFEGARLPSV